MVAGSELCIDEWPVMNSGKDLGGRRRKSAGVVGNMGRGGGG